MPELQIDTAVANRFISSLSKSLQALCHGCMDFDSGIEIVGYININIDSGSKVDYVLNEKVLKSTTNSMTFVSNSFLAKKDQPKQTRDGCCSPVPELQAIPQAGASFSMHMQGMHMGAQHSRSMHHFSPHSRVLRGSQKRTWTGDWRMNPKRQRFHHVPGESPSTQQSKPHSQSFSELPFRQPQTTHSSTETSTDDSNQQLINVKKELELEANNETSQSEHSTSQGETASERIQDPSSELLSKIKSDPDAFPSDSGDTAPTKDNSADNANGDHKNSFLEPPPSENLSHSEQSSQSEGNNPPEGSDQFSAQDSSEQAVMDNQNVPGTSADNTEGELPYDSCEQGSSHMPEEYAQTAEEGSFNQSAYSDAGEGSSDAGQFEVIEIDDEDEDVQAMFNDPHNWSTGVEQAYVGSKERKQRYRTRMKADPERYKAFLAAEAKRVKKARANMTEEQRQRQRELTRIRQKRYRESQKQKRYQYRQKCKAQKSLQLTKCLTEEHAEDEQRRLRNALAARRMRANYTPQKKAAINERRRELYLAKKVEKLQECTMLTHSLSFPQTRSSSHPVS